MDNSEKTDFDRLLQGYLDESLSPEELDIFFSLSGQPENILIIQNKFEDVFGKITNDHTDEVLADEAWKSVQDKLVSPPVRSIRPFIRYIAASVILIVAFTAVYVFKKPTVDSEPNAPAIISKVPAWLTSDHLEGTLYLSQGNPILLNSKTTGVVAKEGNLEILQTDGAIRYSGTSTNPVFNEVRTGRGKLWRVILPDQTIVWLNSNSRIRYPIQMTGKSRTVEISGEVYFDVAHHSGQSFRVRAAGQELQDVGTIFNIATNGPDHNTVTTLVEGAVSIKTDGQQVELLPGEQTIVTPGKNEIYIEKKVKVSGVLAWKNGRFDFQNASVRTVMHQISDWYQVEIIYKDSASQQLFNGQIDKSLSLTQVLQGLKQNGLKFSLDSVNRIIVIQR